MAKNTAHRRSLEVRDTTKSLDFTGRNHPNSAAPNTTATSATVYNLTNHFSRLYKTNDVTSRTRNPQPRNTNLQGKALSKSAILESTTGHFLQQREKTVRIAKESKGAGLEKDKKSSMVAGKVNEMKESRGGKLPVVKEKVKKESKRATEEDKPKVRLLVTGGGSGGGGSGAGGRRRSSCDSQVELVDFFVTNGVRVVSADMPPFMQIHAVSCARKTHDSLEKFTTKTLALTLKKEFDGVYGPAWHCIAGTSFGSFVTHSVGGFLYFSMDQKLYILLFKTTVQRAD
ncbi:hypothetical protein Nepgr_003165 [Nepenthes gracilis]|uniref:Dynein light chain n=1 Tax=Nepenthes gracilis TaxID=150966 RepID=A0AAD3RYZ7_NEPGR|nr:hypothetical protein Nepgr_003165 [Nepenthes gracilis]